MPDPPTDNSIEPTSPPAAANASSDVQAGDPIITADPAAQSLSDALRVSFAILKGVMILLVVFYLASGYFTVDQQQAAVKLRFGQIVGEPGSRVLGPGPHFGLPVPFESRVVVKTAPQFIELDRSFFFSREDAEAGMTLDELAQAGRSGPLDPLRDGYLITGDANIVHGAFRVTFRVTDVEAYVRQLVDDQSAQSMTRSAAEQGLVHAAAEVEADDFIAGRVQLAGATDRANRILTDLSTGITIDRIEVIRPAMPIAARAAYNQVNNAEAERAKAIEEAQRDRARTLQTAGGPAAAPQGNRSDGPLTQFINQYEATPRDDAGRDALEARLESAFRTLTLETDRGPFTIGGQAAQIIEEAQSNRTRLAEGVSREARRFRELDASFRKNPELFKQRLWQSARRSIFTNDNDYEVFYIDGDSTIRIDINRDPAIREAREQRQAEELGVADR